MTIETAMESAATIPTGTTPPVGDGGEAAALTPSAPPPGEAVSAQTVQPSPEQTTEPPAKPQSLVGAEVEKDSAQVEEKAPAEKEAAPAEEPQAPAYEFSLPEGVTLDDGALTEFKTTLGEYKASPELAQKLLNKHLSEITRIEQETQRHQHEVWNSTQIEWQDKVKADPEIGGNRFETTIANCSNLVRQFGCQTEAEMQETQEFLNMTGGGNHPAFIRLMSRISNALKEGQPKPLAPPAPPQTRAQKRYTNGANL